MKRLFAFLLLLLIIESAISLTTCDLYPGMDIECIPIEELDYCAELPQSTCYGCFEVGTNIHFRIDDGSDPDPEDPSVPEFPAWGMVLALSVTAVVISRRR
jgi:hypothetical protein